jgi:hypothetical protein
MQIAEQVPGGFGQAIGLAVSASQEEQQGLVGELFHTEAVVRPRFRSGDLRPVHQLQDCLRIHEGDDDGAVGLFAHDHIAGQQQPDVGLRLQGALIGQGGISGAEDAVEPLLDPQLGLQCGLYVDVAQDAETPRPSGPR